MIQIPRSILRANFAKIEEAVKIEEVASADLAHTDAMK